MTVWIIPTKTTDINATTENAMKKQSSHVKRTRNGIERNVFQGNGYAMEIRIVLVR